MNTTPHPTASTPVHAVHEVHAVHSHDLIPCSLARLQAKAATRRPGYLAAVLERAVTISGDVVTLTRADRDALRRQYTLPTLPEPTIAQLAVNFTAAAAKWITAGFPVTGAAEYQQRAAICNTCDLWDAGARRGLGKCNHPNCGCTTFKRWLATEKCPLAKWPKDSPQVARFCFLVPLIMG